MQEQTIHWLLNLMQPAKELKPKDLEGTLASPPKLPLSPTMDIPPNPVTETAGGIAMGMFYPPFIPATLTESFLRNRPSSLSEVPESLNQTLIDAARQATENPWITMTDIALTASPLFPALKPLRRLPVEGGSALHTLLRKYLANPTIRETIQMTKKLPGFRPHILQSKLLSILESPNALPSRATPKAYLDLLTKNIKGLELEATPLPQFLKEAHERGVSTLTIDDLRRVYRAKAPVYGEMIVNPPESSEELTFMPESLRQPDFTHTTPYQFGVVSSPATPPIGIPQTHTHLSKYYRMQHQSNALRPYITRGELAPIGFNRVSDGVLPDGSKIAILENIQHDPIEHSARDLIYSMEEIGHVFDLAERGRLGNLNRLIPVLWEVTPRRNEHYLYMRVVRDPKQTDKFYVAFYDKTKKRVLDFPEFSSQTPEEAITSMRLRLRSQPVKDSLSRLIQSSGVHMNKRWVEQQTRAFVQEAVNRNADAVYVPTSDTMRERWLFMNDKLAKDVYDTRVPQELRAISKKFGLTVEGPVQLSGQFATADKLKREISPIRIPDDFDIRIRNTEDLTQTTRDLNDIEDAFVNTVIANARTFATHINQMTPIAHRKAVRYLKRVNPEFTDKDLETTLFVNLGRFLGRSLKNTVLNMVRADVKERIVDIPDINLRLIISRKSNIHDIGMENIRIKAECLDLNKLKLGLNDTRGSFYVMRLPVEVREKLRKNPLTLYTIAPVVAGLGAAKLQGGISNETAGTNQ